MCRREAVVCCCLFISLSWIYVGTFVSGTVVPMLLLPLYWITCCLYFLMSTMGSTWWGVCYGKLPFNFKLFRIVLAFKCRRCFSPKRTVPRLIATLRLCAGRLWWSVSEWFRMEACILRFNRRRRRSNLGFIRICGLFSGWQRGLYHCIVCSSLGDEGRAASCKPCILCQTSWTVKDALNKVPQQLMVLL